VQLAQIRKWKTPPAIRRFRTSLKRAETAQRKRVLQLLAGRRKKKLQTLLRKTEEKIAAQLKLTSPARIIERTERTVQTRSGDLESTRANLVASDPSSLHALRVSAKKLRYSLESAEPVLGSASKEQLRFLKNCQLALGEIRDMQLLTDTLREWARDQKDATREAAGQRCLRISKRQAVRLQRFLQTLAEVPGGRTDRDRLSEG
jgi:CHAD domain-containing protein